MSYLIPYEAEFECPMGHLFKTRVSAGSQGAVARCPQCYDEWIAAHVPNGVQVSKPVKVSDREGFAYTAEYR